MHLFILIFPLSLSHVLIISFAPAPLHNVIVLFLIHPNFAGYIGCLLPHISSLSPVLASPLPISGADSSLPILPLPSDIRPWCFMTRYVLKILKTFDYIVFILGPCPIFPCHLIYIHFFIGPESDHWQCLSLTD